MFRIAWKSRITGATGHGEYADFTEEYMKELCARYNKIYPGIFHWYETSDKEQDHATPT